MSLPGRESIQAWKKIGLGQALLELDIAYVNNGQGQIADGCV